MADYFTDNIYPKNGDLPINWVQKPEKMATTENGGGNGGGSGMDRDYVDAKIEATEAKTNEKLGLLRSDISKIDTDMRHLETAIEKKPGLIWTLSLSVGTVLTILGGVTAIITFSNDGFDAGYSASAAYAKEMEKNRAETNERLDKIEKAIINALSEKKK